MSNERPRIEPRTRAVLRARLRWEDGEREVTVIDASSRGMLAMLADPPRRGAIVELVVGHHSLIGQVRWRAGKRIGLSFRERISVAALLEGGAGSIALAGKPSARRNRGGFAAAILVEATTLSRGLQFAVLLAVAGGAAWAVSHYAASGMASLATARSAMAAGER